VLSSDFILKLTEFISFLITQWRLSQLFYTTQYTCRKFEKAKSLIVSAAFKLLIVLLFGMLLLL